MPASQTFRSDLLAGKVAVITGGGSCIGAYIAHELGCLGAEIVIASRKAKNIEPAAAALSKRLGREVLGLTWTVKRERLEMGIHLFPPVFAAARVPPRRSPLEVA